MTIERVHGSHRPVWPDEMGYHAEMNRAGIGGTEKSDSRLAALLWKSLFFLSSGLLVISLRVEAQTTQSPQTRDKKGHDLRWDPPEVDTKVYGLSPVPPCSLPEVLNQAGDRVNELIDHLQNFIAHERVLYKQTDRAGEIQVSLAAKFDYMVEFGGPSSRLQIKENRTLLAGAKNEHLVDILDKGLPALALIFDPELRGDYEMRCQGYSPWNDQPAWLVYFRQDTGKRSRTMTVRTPKGAFPVGLKGRAWIAKDSGQIIHLETNLIEGIPVADLLVNSVSVDYAPVKFKTQNVDVWLPQYAVGYSDFDKRRMIIEHTFSDFQLFSVQTEETIQKPKQP